MVKVVIAKRTAGKPKANQVLVGQKRVRDADGKMITLRTLDAANSSFSDDLTYVFRKNVEKARRENKLATGLTDFVPVKR